MKGPTTTTTNAREALAYVFGAIATARGQVTAAPEVGAGLRDRINGELDAMQARLIAMGKAADLARDAHERAAALMVQP